MCLVEKVDKTDVQMRNFNTVVDIIKINKIKKKLSEIFFFYGNNRVDTTEVRISFKTCQ